MFSIVMWQAKTDTGFRSWFKDVCATLRFVLYDHKHLFSKPQRFSAASTENVNRNIVT